MSGPSVASVLLITSSELSTMASASKTPAYTNHDGFLLPVGFPTDSFDSALKYQAQENGVYTSVCFNDDLFICTYPKCGTTWTQHISYLILNDGKPLPADQRLDTHFPHKFTPANPNAKYIFVARNPKDCVVSFYHHTVGFPRHYHFAEGSFDTYFNLFLEGKVDSNDYFDFLREWLDHKDDPNVLFLRYEAGRKNTREYVLQIASFLDDKVYPQRLLADNEKILKLVMEYSSLDSMKKDARRWCSDRTGFKPFIRKGSTGGWDELLSMEQAEMLQKRLNETFTTEELDFLGEQYQG
eukprot:scaffold1618_cov196-Alexandrium_tamarense.AAC.14